MKKWFRRVLWTVIGAAAIAYGFGLFLSLALMRDCSNEILLETSSSDQRYTATVFERNCGATTRFVTIVSRRVAGTRFDTEATDNLVLALSGRISMTLRWATDRHLIVAGAGPIPDALRSSWEDVKISFE